MDCYLFDLDGTLCDLSHRLHHITGEVKDWPAFYAACGEDQPIVHMLDMAYRLARDGANIVYVTGRSDECRDATEVWLDYHAPTGRVYMRKEGDYRPDDVVKLELLEQVKADGFRPLMAFEDRSRVVKALRAAGIPCAQVADGDF